MRNASRWLQLVVAIAVAHAIAVGAASGRPRLDPEAFFFPPAVSQVSVSPTGDWVVGVASHRNRWGVLVQRRGDRVSLPVYASRRHIDSIQWIGENTLFVWHSQTEQFKAAVIRLRWDGYTTLHDQLLLGHGGFLVHPLVEEDEVVLWATAAGNRSRVYRGPVTGLASGTRWKISGERAEGELALVGELEDPVLHWLADRRGVVRAALAVEGRDDPKLVLKYRSGENERWREVWRSKDRFDVLYPVATTQDDQRLIVAAYGGRDTIGLHEFDPESREFGRVIFVRPGVDVIDAVWDYDGAEIIAAVYQRAGRPEFYYFDGFRDKHLRGVEKIAPGQSVWVTSSSRDHRYFSLLVEGPRNPGVFYFYDKSTGERTQLGEVIPGLRPEQLVAVQILEVVSADRTRVEAFLAAPESEDGGLPPLLVLPHGGPLGVRDDRSFDPLLQYLATYGIAVLKVNYRGSAGYGRAFLEAGKREWSRGIEDDIDAAVQAAIGSGLIDPGRMCIAGGSYGGYSALVSAIRRPDRYRCAASVNGPTDVPLLFQSSDFAATRAGREAFAEVVGDPETEFDRLVEISPLYHVEKLQIPVLIAHGTRDSRVDPDHAHRFRAMLAIHGKPHEWLEMRGAEHSFDAQELLTFARALRAFLRRHLADEAAAGRIGE